jgi:hypothetical protein
MRNSEFEEIQEQEVQEAKLDSLESSLRALDILEDASLEAKEYSEKKPDTAIEGDMQQIRERYLKDLERNMDKSPLVENIVNKLRKGEAIDLSEPKAFGRFGHQAIEEGVRQDLPEAKTEGWIEKAEPYAGERGKFDMVYQDKVYDWKFINFDAPSYRSIKVLDRKLNEIADQIQSYVNSPDLPEVKEGVVFFEFPPSDPERRKYIEQYLAKRGISTLWGRKN